ASNPAVAFNSTANEYLVVWSGDDDSGALIDNEFEVYGQRVNGSTGAEIGGDTRLSDMGQFDGNPAFRATAPDVVYNGAANEYLVVWAGDDDTAPLVDNELEIFGQRVSATGSQIGLDFRLSDMGPNGNSSYGAADPAVAFNSTANEYLVVWMGDDNSGSLVDNEIEIFGQRLNAIGSELGGDFRISNMGPDGDITYDAASPAVAYNSAANQYLVVWHGDDDSGSLVDNELEVFGQRLDAGGGELGNQIRLSDMGPDGDGNFDAFFPPAVAYSGATNQYLVVWMGDDNENYLVNDKFEIFGQRVNAENGTEIGGDTRLSFMGQDVLAYPAFLPDVAYNSTDNEYLVVWAGKDNTPPLFQEGEFEIYAQRVDAATGAEVAPNDVRLSDMGPDGTDDYQALFPAVAYNSVANEYLVVWSSDDDVAPLVDDEFEVFGQRVSASGMEVGPNDFRLSDMGPDGNTNFGTAFAGTDVVYNPLVDEYFVVWAGSDLDGFFQTGVEIFGQRVEGSSGAEIGGDIRVSDMGPENNTDFVAVFPAMAFNSAANEYLVIWSGDDNSGGLVDDEMEIFGQRLNGSTGAEVGANDFRLSDMGPDGNPDYDAEVPDVAYNSAANEYLVVWNGDDDTGSLVDDEEEIFGQRVSATGTAVGTNDFRISQMGPNGNPDYDANLPVVTYNSTLNQYLVAWMGDDNSGSLVDDEFEVYGQQMSASGTNLGSRIRLSDMGPDGDPGFGSLLSLFGSTAIAYGETADTALVVWSGSDNNKPLVSGDIEIFGQLFQAEASNVGAETVYLPVVLK
ncbi:MAG: hypothetical protein KDF65_01850, partial [Anaerolineae bacterium]|nr:hypothetical protein [Anaerolineae bacterium]